MAINMGNSDVASLRARLEQSQEKAAKARKARESRMQLVEGQAAKIALGRLSPEYQTVMVGLEEAGLLSKAEIDYVDRDRRCMPFAWLDKCIGLRVVPSPLQSGDRRMPDFFYNDAALRERGWLILYLEPSRNFEAQLDRVIAVVKRVGAPRSVGW